MNFLLKIKLNTLIQYLLRKEEAPMATDDLPAATNCLEVWLLQVTLEGLAYDTDNRDLYLKLFQSINVSIAGPYVNKFSRNKYGNKE